MVFGDMVGLAVTGKWLDSMISEAFSNWNDSKIPCVYVSPFLCMIFQHAENESPIPKEADYTNETLVSDITKHDRLSRSFPIVMGEIR